MPGKNYSTIGLKPSVMALLKSLTDRFYPGMFLPSTLIMLMNEVRLGYYSVEMRRLAVDLQGRYSTLTIRSDVKKWLEESYAAMSGEYSKKYGTKCFAHFVSYFLANLFESKFDSQNNIIKLKESDFEWLQREYQKHCKEAKRRSDRMTFERFADTYINDLLRKVKAARELLTA